MPSAESAMLFNGTGIRVPQKGQTKRLIEFLRKARRRRGWSWLTFLCSMAWTRRSTRRPWCCCPAAWRRRRCNGSTGWGPRSPARTCRHRVGTAPSWSSNTRAVVDLLDRRQIFVGRLQRLYQMHLMETDFPFESRDLWSLTCIGDTRFSFWE